MPYLGGADAANCHFHRRTVHPGLDPYLPGLNRFSAAEIHTSLHPTALSLALRDPPKVRIHHPYPDFLNLADPRSKS